MVYKEACFNNFVLLLLVMLIPIRGSALTNFESYSTGSLEEDVVLQNDAYRISISRLTSETIPEIKITKKGSSEGTRVLKPEMTVFFSEEDPMYRFGGRGIEGSSPVAFWKNPDEEELWKVSDPIVMTATNMEKNGRSVLFDFVDDGFRIALKLDLPHGHEVPEFSWEITALQEGWYSTGFTGLKDISPDTLDFLYQPLVWSWKRFPVKSVLTPESFATTAATFTNYNGLTEGVAVSKPEIPYRFANHSNSRFGLMLRNENGRAQPMIFAPILGGDESYLKAQEKHCFSIKYFMEEGDWLKGTDYLYTFVLEYKAERQNAMVSLNQTLQNMIDFAMDDFYSGWVEEFKGYDYKFDVPNTVKNVSALHPLSLALTTGNKQIYDRRGLPMLEYLMSREKYLYAINAKPEKQNQNPSHFLNGPAMELWEIASIHSLMGNTNEVFPSEIDRLFGQSRKLNLETEVSGASWKDFLAKYLINNNRPFLDSAIRLADEYLDLTYYNYPTDYSTNAGLKDAQATFVNDYSTNWQELLELYELTGTEKYLDAAYEGAKQLVLWTRSNPFAPDKNITVNKGSKVDGVFPGRRFKPDSYEWQKFDMTTRIQEQVVPAWHTSLVGILPEQPYTYIYGPIMLFHQGGALLRMAHLKKNPLLRDIAYNAILGRYNNFPGYYYTSLETNVYQQTDYPLHPYLEINYNAVFYNHIWPHIALLQDFLVSDTYYRSHGKIDFPSLYSPGYAYLSNKVYGHRTGKIYDNQDIYLWLPKDPFLTHEKSLNHLLGRDENNTYLVLMNTENRMVETEIFLNPSVIKWDHSQKYECMVISEEGEVECTVFENGKLQVTVPSNGLVTYKILGLKHQNIFQGEISAPYVSDTGKIPGFMRKEYTDVALGTISGMTLKMDKGFKDLYVYTTATEEEVKKAILEYRLEDEDWKSLYDDHYPFEFSLRIKDSASIIEWRWKAIDHNEKLYESEVFKLQ